MSDPIQGIKDDIEKQKKEAWECLKENGFKFVGWNCRKGSIRRGNIIRYQVPKGFDIENRKIRKSMMVLFGGIYE